MYCKYKSSFPSLVKGVRLKISCKCFEGSNPSLDIKDLKKYQALLH